MVVSGAGAAALSLRGFAAGLWAWRSTTSLVDGSFLQAFVNEGGAS